MTDPSSELPELGEVERDARALSLGVSASELHGGLCGWLAGGGGLKPDWLGAVLADPAAPVPADGSALQQLAAATASQLADRSFGFDLLLPGGETSLATRSGALFEWCNGFVGAFGLALGAQASLSEEGQEALADLARLARAQAQEEGDDSDEEALVEIEEFVRVAALLLHGDCVLASQHRQRLN
ncbi:UPF0149 family protein [Marilutibacter aestuarii]|uniref:UPF0149 family protein n=1 Tax=Marilutibacter aestuarii TaxID=1706195 RepID=A0A508AER7_9GAMM|nr:UPF0149 family protein [Lysobacter aestuarii]TQD47041.1 UPF0149 family protein [Lysobacter aestuarii]